MSESESVFMSTSCPHRIEMAGRGHREVHVERRDVHAGSHHEVHVGRCRRGHSHGPTCRHGRSEGGHGEGEDVGGKGMGMGMKCMVMHVRPWGARANEDQGEKKNCQERKEGGRRTQTIHMKGDVDMGGREHGHNEVAAGRKGTTRRGDVEGEARTLRVRSEITHYAAQKRVLHKATGEQRM